MLPSSLFSLWEEVNGSRREVCVCKERKYSEQVWENANDEGGSLYIRKMIGNNSERCGNWYSRIRDKEKRGIDIWERQQK